MSAAQALRDQFFSENLRALNRLVFAAEAIEEPTYPEENPGDSEALEEHAEALARLRSLAWDAREALLRLDAYEPLAPLPMGQGR